MNIFFITLTYYPDKNGVQMVNQYLAEGLAKKGYSVTVLTSLKSSYPKVDRHNGVDIVRFSVQKNNIKAKKEFQDFILEYIKDEDILITVCANTLFACWTYSVLEKISCKKIIYQHGMYDGKIHINKINSFKRLAKVLLLTPYWEIFHRIHWKSIMRYNAAIHIFESDSSYMYFKNHKFLNNYVIENSCSPECFEPPKQTGLLEKVGIKNRYFIYVANMCSRKDQMLALECYYKTQFSKIYDIVFIASEENDYAQKVIKREKELRKYAEGNGKLCGKVHILIGKNRRDTIELIQNSYACILTGNNEYLPITIIEAMAAGKPYISTNVGVVSKIPGGNICNDENDICYWLNYYANHPEYVEALGEIARKYAVENCYTDEKVDLLEKILKTI